MKKAGLTYWSFFVLFISSYSPLLLLLILHQIKLNETFLHYGGFNRGALYCFYEKFGLSIFFVLMLFIGVTGLVVLLTNLKKNHHNGINVKIENIENKMSESIAYISTYIVPFLFLDTNDWYGVLSMLVIFTIIFFIYIKSNMVVINPVISPWFTLFQITYSYKNKTKTCLLLTPKDGLEEGDAIKINKVARKIYYGN